MPKGKIEKQISFINKHGHKNIHRDKNKKKIICPACYVPISLECLLNHINKKHPNFPIHNYENLL